MLALSRFSMGRAMKSPIVLPFSAMPLLWFEPLLSSAASKPFVHIESKLHGATPVVLSLSLQ